MGAEQFFPDEEYSTRLRRLRECMREKAFDVLLVSSPENIFYLTGLSHQGHFAYQMLLVPIEEEMILITRAMEKVVVEDQVLPRARWFGFADHEDPARFTVKILEKEGFEKARLGIEKDHMFLPPKIAEGIINGFHKALWKDASGIVEELRMVKSPREILYIRELQE
ncbi:MAG: hypothetical protein DRP87_09735 [Spirochaetes bacterium]|nr:MAG: hypothetical protein DRP87_09735 [Spirochaetota bacterium]